MKSSIVCIVVQAALVDNLFECVEHLAGVAFRLGFGPRQPHQSLGVNEGSASNHTFVFLSLHHLFAPGSKGLKDAVVRITEQSDLQVMLQDDFSV
jgi:hypothetical protein